MPGAGMPILNTIQPIAGVEPHMTIPPLPPAPSPHVVVWGVGLSGFMGIPLAMGSSTATDVKVCDEMLGKNEVAAGLGHPCGRGHDAGPHLGHAAANTLLVIIWLGAASKAEFASGTVKVPTGNLAINCAWVMNVQLECADPIPMPFGVAITLDYTIYAGFTLLDALNGLVHMLVDVLIEAILGVLLGTITELLKGVLDRVFKQYALIGLREAFSESMSSFMDAFKKGPSWSLAERVANLRFTLELIWNSAATRNDVISETASAAWETLFGLSVGGPTGADMPYAPYGDTVGDPIDNAIDGLFYD